MKSPFYKNSAAGFWGLIFICVLIISVTIGVAVSR